MPLSTSTIDLPTPDGTADAFVARPDDGQQHPGVLYYMDAYGLRKQVFDMCERIADAGYFVVAPNVFYRDGRAPLIADLPELMRSKDREKLFGALRPFMSNLSPDGAMRDAGAYLDFLAGRAEVSGGPVGATGYCMGGRLALRTAGTFPDRVAAVASFHGGNLANDAPDSPHLLAPQMRALVYVAGATNDASFPDEQKQRLESALADAHVPHTIETYPAGHGWVPTDTPAHDPACAERHFTALFAFLAETLPR